MSFEEEQLKVLKEINKELGEELGGKPSPVAVQGLVSRLFRAAAGFCGPGIFAELGKAIVEYERAEAGYCAICPGSPRPATDVDDLCDDCRLKFEKEMATLQASEPTN